MYPFYSGSLLMLVLVLWTIPWKVYAAWLAARNNHYAWFVPIILLNTFAILEIYYIFKIAGKSWEEVRKDFNRVSDSVKAKLPKKPRGNSHH